MPSAYNESSFRGKLAFYVSLTDFSPMDDPLDPIGNSRTRRYRLSLAFIRRTMHDILIGCICLHDIVERDFKVKSKLLVNLSPSAFTTATKRHR
jgi:hypothetical protein